MKYVKRGAAAVLFFVGLVGLLWASSWIVTPKNNMKEFGMEEVSANGILGEKDNTIDVLVLGDSESYSAITPMQLWKETGYTAYVCGTSAQTLDYTNRLLRRAFEDQTPKLVILETNAIFRKVALSKAMLSTLGNVLPVFQYHDRWKDLNENDWKGNVKFTWTNDLKGYRYNANIVPSKIVDYMVPTKDMANIPELNRQYVESIKNYCDEHGAKLIFLSTPSTINWNYKRHNAVAQLADDLQCDYVDLNLMTEEVPINWHTDTRDKGDHLNHAGAVKVTRYLGIYLQNRKELTDHRDDPHYAKWDDSLKKYEAKVKAK